MKRRRQFGVLTRFIAARIMKRGLPVVGGRGSGWGISDTMKINKSITQTMPGLFLSTIAGFLSPAIHAQNQPTYRFERMWPTLQGAWYYANSREASEVKTQT